MLGLLLVDSPPLWVVAVDPGLLGPVYKEGGLPKQAGYPSTHTFPLFFLRRVYKAARATRVGGLPYLQAGVTLAGGLTFSLVNTPVRVNPSTRVKLSTCFQTLCSRVRLPSALSCPGW